MDSFSSLYGEANEVVSPASCKGRVVAHVVRTLVLDLFVNYRYCAATRRMVKSPVELKVRQDTVYGVGVLPHGSKAQSRRRDRALSLHALGFYSMDGHVETGLVIS